MEREMTTLEMGLGFDLNQTTLAYRLGGKDTHWTDYTYDWYNKLSMSDQVKDENLDNAWNQDSYYADFDAWWSSLDEKEREEICNLICVKK